LPQPMKEQAMRTTAPGLVVEKILAQLRGRELKPGDRLASQRQLASALGVSRPTIREAINALSGMGYLYAVQGKGTFIRDGLSMPDSGPASWNSILEAGSIFDLMEARELLECKSAELAAKRAKKENLRQIKEIVKRIGESGNDINRFFEADLDFHLALAEASGNKVICEIIKILIKNVLKYHTYFRATSSAAVRKLAFRTSSQILTYLRNRDGEKAAEGMRSHLNMVSRELKEIILELAPALVGVDKRLYGP